MIMECSSNHSIVAVPLGQQLMILCLALSLGLKTEIEAHN